MPSFEGDKAKPKSTPAEVKQDTSRMLADLGNSVLPEVKIPEKARVTTFYSNSKGKIVGNEVTMTNGAHGSYLLPGAEKKRDIDPRENKNRVSLASVSESKRLRLQTNNSVFIHCYGDERGERFAGDVTIKIPMLVEGDAGDVSGISTPKENGSLDDVKKLFETVGGLEKYFNGGVVAALSTKYPGSKVEIEIEPDCKRDDRTGLIGGTVEISVKFDHDAAKVQPALRGFLNTYRPLEPSAPHETFPAPRPASAVAESKEGELKLGDPQFLLTGVKLEKGPDGQLKFSCEDMPEILKAATITPQITEGAPGTFTADITLKVKFYDKEYTYKSAGPISTKVAGMAWRVKFNLQP